MGKTIVWFRKDLRLHDHPALIEAAAHGEVLPVFILPENVHQASDWWLHGSLLDMREAFGKFGVQFIVRKGKPADVLPAIQEESGADQLVYNELYDPVSLQEQREVTDIFESRGIQVRSYQGLLLVPPSAVLNKTGGPYKVFTPFWKRLRQEAIAAPLAAPDSLSASSAELASLSPDEWALLSGQGWVEKLGKYWKPGEAAALDCWKVFRENGLRIYKDKRDEPALPAVSRLSPYLSSGNISVRSLWHGALQETELVGDDQTEAFLRQLAWRDFAYYQLTYFPQMLTEPMRPEFKKFPWQPAGDMLDRWEKGLTGYPLVDAGMRELWETGYMHNRVRLVAASFLIKHLLIDWREGQKWFEQTLVDWDEANNAMGWQWVAGSGFDASPYFRVFNPTMQGEKFDGAGAYVKKWLPELKELPEAWIFRPAEAPADVLQEAVVEIGTDYPAPVVDHKAARTRALAAHDSIKN